MLYIIVPVFNRIESTKQFISSLQSQDYKNYRVIIVDDGSSDGTSSYLKMNYPDIDVIPGNGNLFWGGAINLGLNFLESKLHDGDIIAFSNNDITLFSDTITSLLAELQNNSESIFHPVTINEKSTCISSGAILKNWMIFLTKHPFRGKPYNEIKEAKKISIDFATARFLLFDSKLLKKVPRIDTQNFIHYAGDNDFSMRLKQYGHKTYIIPKSCVMLDTSTTGENPQSIKTLKQFISSLSSVKSTNNLKVRFKIGSKFCPKFQLPFYYLSVLLQVIILNLRSK